MIRSLQNSEGRPPERRATQRFSIVAPLEYKAFRGHVLVREGVGRTINFGSRGILFQIGLLWNPICAWNSRLSGQCSTRCVRICEFMRSAKSFDSRRVRWLYAWYGRNFRRKNRREVELL